MRITGKWEVGSDGITRPLLCGQVRDASGNLVPADFLIDTGADTTVFSAGTASILGLAGTARSGVSLYGIGGQSPYVVVGTMIELTADDGTRARVHGQFAAFTDPAAADMSILGRDVLEHFDLIISRRRNEILLLAGAHQYAVS